MNQHDSKTGRWNSEDVKAAPPTPAGLGRLTADAIAGISGIAEGLHQQINHVPVLHHLQRHLPFQGLTTFIYQQIRFWSQTTGETFDKYTLDAQLRRIESTLASTKEDANKREHRRAILNGIIGDYLYRSKSALAIPMQFKQQGQPLSLAAAAKQINKTQGQVIILIHGLCMYDSQWTGKCGHNHGTALAKATSAVQIDLHYNSGLPISQNGEALSTQLSALAAQCKSNLSITILAHSMGGLVTRSACYYAKQANAPWLHTLNKVFFLGTPHHGALLERGGNIIDTALDINRYSAPFSQLGKLRSQGITDLRFGNVIEADWQDRDRFEWTKDLRKPAPLPAHADCYAIAAVQSAKAKAIGEHIIGDGLVTLNSALGRHTNPELTLNFPEKHTTIRYNMGHNALLHAQCVYKQIEAWALRSD